MLKQNPNRVLVYHNDVCKFECASEEEAKMYLYRVQPNSILSAITDFGWRVRVEYDDKTVDWNEEYYGLPLC